MLISSWLRNWNHPAPAARRRTSPSPRSRAAFRPRLETLEDRSVPATLTVTTAADTSNGALSLRAAIAAAHNGDTIAFDAGLAGQAFVLTGGELAINKSVTIQGTPGHPEAIGSAGFTRVLNISGAAQVTLDSLVIVDGFGAEGAGIYNDHATVAINNCLLGNNSTHSTSLNGGAIYNNGGTVTISHSTLSNNDALFHYLSGGGNGGAIYNNGGTVTISDSTLSDNAAYYSGGCIYNNGGTVTVSNSGVAGNFTYYGGGGLYNTAGGSITLNSTIVAGNTAPNGPDLWSMTGIMTGGDYNLIGVIPTTLAIGGTHNKTGTLAAPLNPMLAPLANNGGLTQTRALLPGSPAINAGSNPASLTTDQRGYGYVRVSGGQADIGAFEVQFAPTVTGVVFGDGTNQRSLVKQIVVTFSEAVNFSPNVASAFTLARTATGGSTGNVTLAANPASGPASVVTITFSGSLTEFGSLVDGLYDLTISAGVVSGVGGALDGNSDSIPGGSYSVTGTTANKFFRLFGDSDGDATTTLTDFAAFRSVYNLPTVVFDFDNNGIADLNDFTQFRSRYHLSP